MSRRRESGSRRSWRRSEGRSDSTRTGIRLATIATLVGIITSFLTIALGAFDLRDKVASVEAKDDPTLTPSAYVEGVAEVCDEREESQVARRADALELKRRMAKAAAFARQGALILDFIQKELDRSDHALATFAGLAPPEDAATEHRAVVRRWEANIDRIRAHRDAVEAAPSRGRLVMVLGNLKRSVVETEKRRVEAGLRRLGGATGCDIALPQPVPPVFLPGNNSPAPQPAAPASETPSEPTVEAEAPSVPTPESDSAGPAPNAAAPAPDSPGTPAPDPEPDEGRSLQRFHCSPVCPVQQVGSPALSGG